MKKLMMFFVICTCIAGAVFGQTFNATSYITENDFGRATFIFADNETEATLFYQLFIRVYDEGGMFFYPPDDPSEQRQELIEIFLIIIDQFFYEWRHYPESFTLVADIIEGEITEYQISIISLDVFDVMTNHGVIEHLNFVFIGNFNGDEVLFCNIM